MRISGGGRVQVMASLGAGLLPSRVRLGSLFGCRIRRTVLFSVPLPFYNYAAQGLSIVLSVRSPVSSPVLCTVYYFQVIESLGWCSAGSLCSLVKIAPHKSGPQCCTVFRYFTFFSGVAQDLSILLSMSLVTSLICGAVILSGH